MSGFLSWDLGDEEIIQKSPKEVVETPPAEPVVNNSVKKPDNNAVKPKAHLEEVEKSEPATVTKKQKVVEIKEPVKDSAKKTKHQLELKKSIEEDPKIDILDLIMKAKTANEPSIEDIDPLFIGNVDNVLELESSMAAETVTLPKAELSTLQKRLEDLEAENVELVQALEEVRRELIQMKDKYAKQIIEKNEAEENNDDDYEDFFESDYVAPFIRHRRMRWKKMGVKALIVGAGVLVIWSAKLVIDNYSDIKSTFFEDQTPYGAEYINSSSRMSRFRNKTTFTKVKHENNLEPLNNTPEDNKVTSQPETDDTPTEISATYY